MAHNGGGANKATNEIDSDQRRSGQNSKTQIMTKLKN